MCIEDSLSAKPSMLMPNERTTDRPTRLDSTHRCNVRPQNSNMTKNVNNVFLRLNAVCPCKRKKASEHTESKLLHSTELLLKTTKSRMMVQKKCKRISIMLSIETIVISCLFTDSLACKMVNDYRVFSFNRIRCTRDDDEEKEEEKFCSH